MIVILWAFAGAAVLYGGALVLAERWNKPPRHLRKREQLPRRWR